MHGPPLFLPTLANQSPSGGEIASAQFSHLGTDPLASLIPSQLLLHPNICLGLPTAYYQACLADAWPKLHAIQDRAVELRAAFLESLIESTKCTSDKA
jgi:hypothetical protein